MFIAAKYEEVLPLKLETISEKVSHHKFSKLEIKSKECEILQALDFQVLGPNILSFVGLLNHLVVRKKCEGAFGFVFVEDSVVGLLGKALSYFAKLTLYEYNLVSRVECSVLGMAVVYAALKLVGSACENCLKLNEIVIFYFFFRGNNI